MKTHNEEQIFNSPTTFRVLPREFVSRLDSSTTPSVLNVRRFTTSDTVVTVTNFDEGAEGQTIMIVGDGKLTVANGATIKTTTAANKLLAVNRIYTFTLINNVWYES